VISSFLASPFSKKMPGTLLPLMTVNFTDSDYCLIALVERWPGKNPFNIAKALRYVIPPESRRLKVQLFKYQFPFGKGVSAPVADSFHA
jgi:hypothetical protein